MTAGLPIEELGAPMQPQASRPRAAKVHSAMVLGAVFVGLIILAALVSFIWTPRDPFAVQASNRFALPSREHLFGTDQLGRDILSRVLMGARTTLFVGTVAVAIGGSLGTLLGVVSAMTPAKWLQTVMSRTSDFMLSFPAVLLAIILAAAYGGSTTTAIVAIGIAAIPIFARVARGATLQVLSTEYVAAARTSGRTEIAIALRHVLPNISSYIIVQASVTFAMAILAEAALSYLGLGTAPPTPSWGRMLQEAQRSLFVAPMVAFWPGISVAVAVLGFNLLGDGLRDRLDPRLQGR